MVREFYDVEIKVPRADDKSNYKFDDHVTFRNMLPNHVFGLMDMLTQYADEVGFEIRFHREAISEDEIAQAQAQMDCASEPATEVDAEPIEGEEVW